MFAIFDTDMSTYEREALEFLYAYMPLADITDYPGEFHLMNVRAAQQAAREMPWGKTIPEELFRHFVLPVRVNNESLDSARVVFYKELKDRVKSLSLYDAILEVNHWCHEKVIYTPGLFVNADLDKASTENERNAVTVRMADGRRITFIQVAGLVARRIICYATIGQELARGERYGFIRFGSRVDVYLPADAEIVAQIGDKMTGVSSTIARL